MKKTVLSQGMYDAHTNIQMLRYMANHTTNVNMDQFRCFHNEVMDNLRKMAMAGKLSKVAFEYFTKQRWAIRNAVLTMYEGDNWHWGRVRRAF